MKNSFKGQTKVYKYNPQSIQDAFEEASFDLERLPTVVEKKGI